MKRHGRKITSCSALGANSNGRPKATAADHMFALSFGSEDNTTLCTKDPTAPAKCALCGGEHTASYKRCVSYKNLNQARGKIYRSNHPTATQTSTPAVNINDSSQFPPYIISCTRSQQLNPELFLLLLHILILLHTNSSRSILQNCCLPSLSNLKQFYSN